MWEREGGGERDGGRVVWGAAVHDGTARVTRLRGKGVGDAMEEVSVLLPPGSIGSPAPSTRSERRPRGEGCKGGGVRRCARSWGEFIDYKTSMITDEDPLRGLLCY